jgi:hypothetical protein
LRGNAGNPETPPAFREGHGRIFPIGYATTDDNTSMVTLDFSIHKAEKEKSVELSNRYDLGLPAKTRPAPPARVDGDMAVEAVPRAPANSGDLPDDSETHVGDQRDQK